MNQAPAPTSTSPETQRLIDLSYQVVAGKMDLYPELENLVSQRQGELVDIPKSQFLGGVVIQSIDFSKEQPLRYRGGLFVVHEDVTLPFETMQTEFVRGRSTELSRTQLMHAMVRVAPYPGGWIRRAEPCQVIDYLNAVHGVRMMSTYGRLRSHSH